MRRTAPLLILIIAAITLAGCSTQQPAESQTTATTPPVTSGTPAQHAATPVPTPISQASVSDNTVTIKDFAFSPQTITVKTGATVRWENRDSVTHRIMFTDSAGRDTNDNLDPLGSSQSYSRKFTEPGTYPYYCKIHPEMKGTVIVE